MLAAFALTAVAAAGVLTPFRRGGAPALEPRVGALQDQRDALFRTLRDLDDDRARGAIEDADYRVLRADTERRAVVALRALETTTGPEDVAAGLRGLRAVPENGAPLAGRLATRRPVVLIAAAVVVALAAVVLARSLAPREDGGTITGGPPAESLAFFEQRVAAHPQDVAARLDLAARYEEAGRLDDAEREYRTTIRLDPTNSEAHAELGYLFFLGGAPAPALTQERLALSADSGYPNALYYEGLVLLEGLHRPQAAAAAFRAYLAASPDGARAQEARGLLRQISSR
jgi:tetratricopeptide (TPR) repeat protein